MDVGCVCGTMVCRAGACDKAVKKRMLRTGV